MRIIETKDLTKSYRRYKKQAGLAGSIRGLVKREYEEKIAVKGMNFSAEEGEVVGLIGPNGAGKTTLVKMLTGIIAPTAGKIDVLGFEPNQLKNAFKQQYAVVMGQKSQLFFELTTEDTLHLFKEIYSISEQEFQKRKEYFTNLFEVEDLMNVQVRTLSLGERMKMELIVALLHQPKILFLDEPTIGLDVIASKQIRKFLKEVNETQGTTILLTSHYMEDIKALCQRSIVMNHGQKLYDGDTDQLFERFQHNKRITVTLAKPIGWSLDPYGAKIIENANDKLVMDVPKARVSELLARLMENSPSDISVEEEEIGNVVERIYRSGTNKVGGRSMEDEKV